MSYRRFETDNAKYILGLMNHGFEENLESALSNNGFSRIGGLKPSLFDEVDGLVVEDSGEGIIEYLKNYFNPDHKRNQMYLMGDPCLRIIGSNYRRVPLFTTDIFHGLTPKEINIIDNSNLNIVFHYWFNFVKEKLFSFEELSGTIQWITQLGSYIVMDPQLEERNAINSEKIEKWVVPRVAHYSGKAKPLIGLMYGAAHVSIEQNLKNNKRREKIINKMYKDERIDKIKFNLVQEAVYDKDSRTLNVREFDTGLFKD